MRAVDFASKCGKTILACRYETYNGSNDGNKHLLENGIASNVMQGLASLSYNERRLLHLEEAWQKKQREAQAEEQLEWDKHPLSKKMSYALTIYIGNLLVYVL